jgi:hypothetical protein
MATTSCTFSVSTFFSLPSSPSFVLSSPSAGFFPGLFLFVLLQATSCWIALEALVEPSALVTHWLIRRLL